MIFEIGLAKHHVRFCFTPTNTRVVLHSISQIKPRLFVPGGVVNPRNSGAILAAMIVVKSTGCSSTTTRTAKPKRGPWTRTSCPCGMCTSRHQGIKVSRLGKLRMGAEERRYDAPGADLNVLVHLPQRWSLDERLFT